MQSLRTLIYFYIAVDQLPIELQRNYELLGKQAKVEQGISNLYTFTI